MILRLLALLFVLALAAAAGAFYWLNQPNLNTDPVVIDIRQGDTLNQLATRWQDEGWLRSALSLKIISRISGLGHNIRPGEFVVPPQLSNHALLVFLEEARAKTYRVTLIEGQPLALALAELAETRELVQDITPLTAERVAGYLGLSGTTEGQLYPDTYVFHRNDTVSSLLTQAHERLQSVLEEEWQQRDKGLPYASAEEALIMASIVEKETGVASERPVIAGVFVRRLQKGMRLETDPTVIYGLGADYEGNLRRSHLRDDSNLYNTYRHKGLPPGPIALAGRAAIHAALHPADGTELYFVAKGDGSHYFSSTLAEHTEAVKRYQLNRRSDYRSSPATQTRTDQQAEVTE